MTRSVLEDFTTRADYVAAVGELHRLFIVHDHAVHFGQEIHEFRTRNIDPQIHGVAHGKRLVWEAPQQIKLHERVRVGKEQHLAIEVRGRNGWWRFFQDSKTREERLASIHVVKVSTAPCKRLAARATLKSLQAHVGECAELLLVRFRPITADGADHAYRRQLASSCCEIRATSAEDSSGLACGCVQCVNSDGSGDEKGHSNKCTQVTRRFQRAWSTQDPWECQSGCRRQYPRAWPSTNPEAHAAPPLDPVALSGHRP